MVLFAGRGDVAALGRRPKRRRSNSTGFASVPLLKICLFPVPKVLENEILKTAKVVEEHLDAEIQKLDQMDEDELERLKQRRLEALKKAQQQKQVILILP
ncbi:hypothetical protein CIB84_011532 [Bambusicola thoracicus]|uniref:Uncharacterized protein n=1 Tax=Bambusicola thoracicus TaxID=9083 RepID=A0A2P4SKS8_BAMTH|nr:hypothetical protein CIB84_011532 [Bambusicola thoracicus]